MASDTKINRGLKTPAIGNDDLLKNAGGMVRTLTQKQISDEARPPKSPPKGLPGKSVRV